MLRYSMGARIDGLFAEIVELVSGAMFGKNESREAFITKAIRVDDVLKFMLYALLELNGLEKKYFLEVSAPLEEVGKMLYGWKNQIAEQNRVAGGKDASQNIKPPVFGNKKE